MTRIDLDELEAKSRVRMAARPLACLRPIALLEPGGWTLRVYDDDQLVMVVECMDGKLTGNHVGSDDILRLLDRLVEPKRLIDWLDAMAHGAKDGACALVEAY